LKYELKKSPTAMSAASRYWKIVKIDATGGIKIQEIAAAKEFFLASFPELMTQSEVQDVIVQRQLMQWMKESNLESIVEQSASLKFVCNALFPVKSSEFVSNWLRSLVKIIILPAEICYPLY
jgi:hypothetical protein